MSKKVLSRGSWGTEWGQGTAPQPVIQTVAPGWARAPPSCCQLLAEISAVCCPSAAHRGNLMPAHDGRKLPFQRDLIPREPKAIQCLTAQRIITNTSRFTDEGGCGHPSAINSVLQLSGSQRNSPLRDRNHSDSVL